MLLLVLSLRWKQNKSILEAIFISAEGTRIYPRNPIIKIYPAHISYSVKLEYTNCTIPNCQRTPNAGLYHLNWRSNYSLLSKTSVQNISMRSSLHRSRDKMIKWLSNLKPLLEKNRLDLRYISNHSLQENLGIYIFFYLHSDFILVVLLSKRWFTCHVQMYEL